MSKSNIRFLSSVLAMAVFGITGVSAAPSVRMLGTNTARVGTNATVVKSDNSPSASTQRLGSIRAKNVSTVAPVSVNKVPSKINTVNASDESRLSLGKYIHNAGLSAGTIKPVAAGASNAGVLSSEFDNLVGRVQNLESGKQDTIALGEGLVMDGNKISLDSTLLQTQVEDTLEDKYYTATQVDKILEESGIVAGGPTYTSITNEENTYNAIDIADEFDEEGFSFDE